MSQEVNFKRESIGQKEISKLEGPLSIISRHWGLKLSRAKDFKTASKILKNSVKNN